MKKNYSLLEVFSHCRSMSDFHRAISHLSEIKNTVPGDSVIYMDFKGSHFDLVIEFEPKDKDDRKYFQRLGFTRN